MTNMLQRRATAAVAVAASATAVVVYSPQLLTDSGQFSRVPLVLRVGWLVLMLLAPPLVAFLAARRRGGSAARVSIWVGTPLPLLALLLVWLDVWLEVRSGYLLAGSGEEAMSYGIGTTMGVLGGGVLTVLVTVAARTGVVAGRRDRDRSGSMAATGSRSSGR